jgi:hypothetical protein
MLLDNLLYPSCYSSLYRWRIITNCIHQHMQASYTMNIQRENIYFFTELLKALLPTRFSMLNICGLLSSLHDLTNILRIQRGSNCIPTKMVFWVKSRNHKTNFSSSSIFIVAYIENILIIWLFILTYRADATSMHNIVIKTLIIKYKESLTEGLNIEEGPCVPKCSNYKPNHVVKYIFDFL